MKGAFGRLRELLKQWVRLEVSGLRRMRVWVEDKGRSTKTR